MEERHWVGSFIAGLAFMIATGANADSCDDFPRDHTQKSCSELAFDEASAVLASVLDQIRQRLAGDQATAAALEDAQEAWDRFARAECSFKGSGIGSASTRALIFYSCMQGMTQARATDLEHYLHCEEGDITCRVPNGD